MKIMDRTYNTTGIMHGNDSSLISYVFDYTMLIMKAFCTRVFSVFNEMFRCFQLLSLLIWWIQFIDFYMLNHSVGCVLLLSTPLALKSFLLLCCGLP